MPEDAPRPAQAAIHTALGAIFVSLELSRRTWLITSLSPGGGEKMSKHSVPAGECLGCCVGSPNSGAKLRRGPAGTSRLLSSRRPVWTAFGSTGCCSRKGSRATSSTLPRYPDLAPASAGEDRPDRWRDPGAHPDGLQAWRAAGVFDGQGANAGGGGPAACVSRAPDTGGRAGEARQPDQRTALRPGGVRLRAAAQESARAARGPADRRRPAPAGAPEGADYPRAGSARGPAEAVE